jgi:hypothetical protein
MYKYFLYSDEQISEKNKILSRSTKEFVPGTVVVNGRRVKFTQLSSDNKLPRFIDTRIVAEGEISNFVYTMPSSSTKRGN